MDTDKDNANPTILSASQLPTRQKKKRPAREGPDTKYSDIVLAKPAYLARWPSDGQSQPGASESWIGSDDGDDEFTEEPIDEQEIYGRSRPFSFPPALPRRDYNGVGRAVLRRGFYSYPFHFPGARAGSTHIHAVGNHGRPRRAAAWHIRALFPLPAVSVMLFDDRHRDFAQLTFQKTKT